MPRCQRCNKFSLFSFKSQYCPQCESLLKKEKERQLQIQNQRKKEEEERQRKLKEEQEKQKAIQEEARKQAEARHLRKLEEERIKKETQIKIRQERESKELEAKQKAKEARIHEKMEREQKEREARQRALEIEAQNKRKEEEKRKKEEERKKKEEAQKLLEAKEQKSKEAKLKQIQKTKIESIIEFGNYRQDYLPYSLYRNAPKVEIKKQPIKWIILDIKGTQALLLSQYALSKRRYTEYISIKSNSKLLWSESNIKNYLNTDFYKEAFSEKEQHAIIQTITKNEKTNNPSKKTSSDTEIIKDNVFLLSQLEVEKYFSTFPLVLLRKAEQTYACRAQRAMDGQPYASWWLRSSVSGENVLTIDCYGEYRQEPGTKDGIAIRPAIWVDLTEIR